MAVSFRYSSDITGLGHLALSQAYSVVADNKHTVNALPIGARVIAVSTMPGVGTYVICGVATGATTDMQPYTDTYQLMHRVTWITSTIMVPVSVCPVSTTTSLSTTESDLLFNYAAAQAGLLT